MRKEDNKDYFYQWELGQRLIVNENCSLVLFSNGTLADPLSCEVRDGYVEVPNILLQTAAQLHAYAWNKETTSVIGHSVFSVIPMPKPSDYIYTETEHITIEKMVKQALERAKESGDFKGEPGEKGETGVPGKNGADGKDGAPGKDGADGYTPQRGVDYWTEEDKTEIKSYVDEAILGGEW